MITTLTLRNTGAHAALTLPLGKTITVSARSGMGKTQIIAAYLALVLGVGDLRIRRGEKVAEASGTTAGGLALTARTTPSGTSRTVARPGVKAIPVGSQRDYADRLGELAEAMLPDSATPADKAKRSAMVRAYLRDDVTRAIVDPHEWVRLYDDRKGQGLTDLLARIVPLKIEDKLAELMAADGFTARAADPRVAKGKGGAEERSRDANRAENEARGARDEADRAALAAKKACDDLPQPDDAAKAQAESDIDAGKAWAAYDLALTRWEAGEGQRKAAQARLDAWTAEEVSAGPRPAYDPAEHHRVRTALGEARAEVRRIEEDARKAEEAERLAKEREAAEARRLADAARAEEARKAAEARAEADRVAAEERARVEAEAARQREAALLRQLEATRAVPPPAIVAATDKIGTLFGAAPSTPTITCPECGHNWSPS